MIKSLLRYWYMLNTWFGVINILAPVANKKKMMPAFCGGSVFVSRYLGLLKHS